MLNMLETREIFLIVLEQIVFLVIGSHTLYVDRMLHASQTHFWDCTGYVVVVILNFCFKEAACLRMKTTIFS